MRWGCYTTACILHAYPGIPVASCQVSALGRDGQFSSGGWVGSTGSEVFSSDVRTGVVIRWQTAFVTPTLLCDLLPGCNSKTFLSLLLAFIS